MRISFLITILIITFLTKLEIQSFHMKKIGLAFDNLFQHLAETKDRKVLFLQRNSFFSAMA